MEEDKKTGFFALVDALIEAQSSIKHATKDGVNPYFKSGYATLEQVITAVKKPLNDNGIYFQQQSHEYEGGACVETTFWGHEANLSTGRVTIPAERNDAQSFGSALTYAKRYSLSMACGIGHQADDDGNNATFERPSDGNSKPTKKPAVKPTQKKAPVVKKEESKKEAPVTDSKPKAEQKKIAVELVEPASYAKIKDEDGAMEVADRLVAMAKATTSVKELMGLAEGNAPAKKVLEDDWPDVHSIVVKAYGIKWDSLVNEEKEKTDD